MSVLAPMWLVGAALVAAGVVVAHLFSTSVPPREVLPTVHFIPEGAPLAVMRTRRITDWLLLMLRLAAVALFGLALAGAHVPRTPPRRVLLVDQSRAVGLAAELRDSARAYADGAVIIAFDSTARHIAADSLASLTPSGARGSMSAALVAAHRILVAVTAGRGDAELVIVSPVVREEVDSATTRLLALWEGPARVVPVQAAEPAAPPTVHVRSPGDDPISAVVSSRSAPLAAVRVIRTLPTGADSAWVRDTAGALVLWPFDGSGLTRRVTADTSGAIRAGVHVVVSSFVRRHQPRSGRAIAHWADGDPAATEQPVGGGCIREVAIPVDPIGDVALRASFRGVVGVLTEPCGGAVMLSDAKHLVLANAVGDRLTRSPSDLAVAGAGRVPLILALLALGALIGEQAIRRRRRAA